jgi:hypothetical protein
MGDKVYESSVQWTCLTTQFLWNLRLPKTLLDQIEKKIVEYLSCSRSLWSLRTCAVRRTFSPDQVLLSYKKERECIHGKRILKNV